jgi:hypothetical protein
MNASKDSRKNMINKNKFYKIPVFNKKLKLFSLELKPIKILRNIKSIQIFFSIKKFTNQFKGITTTKRIFFLILMPYNH